MTFQANKGPEYARNEVDVKLSSGRVIKAKAATGGWMGPTSQRPYPDFREVTVDIRIERDDLYMGISSLFSQRSTCLRGHVGCVAVVENHIVAAGYNGAPPGLPHCIDVGCDGGKEDDNGGTVFPNGCTRSIHAEQNMVAYAARNGIPLNGCTVYATHGPCLPCAQAMISAGMSKLVYETPYRRPEGLKLVDQASVEVVQYGH